MLNQTVVVGRLTGNPELEELENGTKVTNITLAVQRSYKNENGEYDSDFIKCTLWKGVAENTSQYCQKGDLVGVKGRLQTNTYEDENGNKKSMMNLIGEKVTFLTSKAKDQEMEV